MYLGYQIERIRPNSKNMSVFRDYPVPTNSKALHSFLGLALYFRRFIHNFSVMAKPLFDLLWKNVPFYFGIDKLNSFKEI